MAAEAGGTILLDVRPCDWKEADRRAQHLRASAPGAQALAAVDSGASMISPAARDRLASGLDAFALNGGWLGLVIAWLDALLRDRNAGAPPTSLSPDALVTQCIESCLPLVNFAGGVMLDVSAPGVSPAMPLAMLRPDATLVLPVADPAHAGWLRACAHRLGIENFLVLGRGLEDLHVSPHFQLILSRDGRPLDDLIASTRHLLAMGGRWYVLRPTFDPGETQALTNAVFVQAMEVSGSQTTARVLHIVNMAASPHSAAHTPPVPAPAEEPAALLPIPEILAAAAATLDRIEAEMKEIGFWSADPPPLLEMADRGEIRSYLDAPCFEQWLQCIFLARARAAILNDDLPDGSNVAGMAMRQYDYHSHVPEAETLLELLREFDALVEQRARHAR